MRRLLSILIVALFVFAPLAALLPGLADTQLPACCRRHGAHHCAMPGIAIPPSGTHQLAAPSHCPLYRAGHLVPTPVFTLGHASSAAALFSAFLIPAPSASAVLSRAGNSSSRAPPSAC